MRINYDFADLEAFLAVKETGSFHLASEKLNLSQSAITRRVQKLETALNSELFERTTRKVRPTLAAKRLQARAEAILEEADETARAMRDESMAFAHQRSLVVTLAIVPTVLDRLIPAAIRRFRDAGHLSRIRFLDCSANGVSESVALGEADFGICSIPTLEVSTEFETLFEDRIVLAMAANSPMTGHDFVPWAALEDVPLILPARGTGNRLLIDEAAARAHHSLRWTFEAQRSTTALSLVAGGLGAALLPQSALLDQVDGRVAWRPLARPVVSRAIGILSRVGQSDSTEIASLKAAIRRAV